jgi:hypothetical protein
MIFLVGINLLKFWMGVEQRILPQLDIPQTGPEPLGQLLHEHRGVPSHGTGNNPIPGFHHIENLLGGPLFIPELLLDGRAHLILPLAYRIFYSLWTDPLPLLAALPIVPKG